MYKRFTKSYLFQRTKDMKRIKHATIFSNENCNAVLAK